MRGGPGAPRAPKPRLQRTPRPPPRFPPQITRRDYAKPETGAEQPLGFAEGSKSGFGQTGLTGES